jgi:hypothetical protein
MNDGFTATLESASLLAAFDRLPDTILKYTVPASKVSADSIQREAQRRVRRDTGETAQGIIVDEMRNGTGYVVVSVNRRMPNLPLWIEAGTKRGKPGSHTDPGDPFFYPAIRLELNAHTRRIDEAVARGIAAEGLGQ